MLPGSLRSHPISRAREAGVGQDGTRFLAGVEQKQGRSIFLFSSSLLHPPQHLGNFKKFNGILVLLCLPRAFPGLWFQALRINLLVTLLNQLLPEKGPGCKDDRNQTSNGFQEQREVKPFPAVSPAKELREGCGSQGCSARRDSSIFLRTHGKVCFPSAKLPFAFQACLAHLIRGSVVGNQCPGWLGWLLLRYAGRK